MITDAEWRPDRPFSMQFKMQLSPERSAELWATLAKLARSRACRTCDYGDDPACGHEQRAQRACQAPVGDFDCAITPCLGACATPSTVTDWQETEA